MQEPKDPIADSIQYYDYISQRKFYHGFANEINVFEKPE